MSTSKMHPKSQELMRPIPTKNLLERCLCWFRWLLLCVILRSPSFASSASCVSTPSRSAWNLGNCQQTCMDVQWCQDISGCFLAPFRAFVLSEIQGLKAAPAWSFGGNCLEKGSLVPKFDRWYFLGWWWWWWWWCSGAGDDYDNGDGDDGYGTDDSGQW